MSTKLQEVGKKKKVIGIDLGTTNSVISVLEGSIPTIIINSEGQRTTPSVVAYRENEEPLVGLLAKRQSVVNPIGTIYSVKRFIGCRYNDVIQETKNVSYKLTSGENGRVKIICPTLNKQLSPEEVSAVILKKLAQDASQYLNETVTEAVITVPAYFSDSQRLATKDAGSIAGLEVLRILNEPTAAALAYGLDKKKNEIVLIFDLGGGTFDVSILEVGQEVFEVLSTSGDAHLGGDDFDKVIVDFLIKDFQKNYEIDLSKEKQALQRIIEAAEKAKIELSISDSTRINIPYIFTRDKISKDIDLIYERSLFEFQSKELLERCKKPVFKALEDAKLKKENISEVILVGGSTRIPAVRALLSEIMNKPLNEAVNPDEVVALGAAIQGGIMAGEITDLILLDVSPLSLGVETTGGVMTPVIKRNSSIPIIQAETFSTSSDNQETVDVHVLQGERAFAKDNRSLGVFKLGNIPKAPRGIPQIKVTFNLDVDGLLTVSAQEQKSGQFQSINIQGASVLGRDEISKLIEDSNKNITNDKIRKFFSTILYESDIMFSNIEKIITFFKSKKIDFLNYLISIFTQLKYFLIFDQIMNLKTDIKKLVKIIDLLLENFCLELIIEKKIERKKKRIKSSK